VVGVLVTRVVVVVVYLLGLDVREDVGEEL
jgi:hypothetical protein